MSENLYEALASSIYYSAMMSSGKSITTDDQRIRLSGLYPQWHSGVWQTGALCNALGQTWECFAAVDNAIYPGVTPEDPSWYTFFRPLHGKSPESARPFVDPTGAHDTYKPGEHILWTDGKLFRCTRETAYGPDSDTIAWEPVSPL